MRQARTCAAGEVPAVQPDIARAAALIADASRARILKTLSDGRAVPASVLAAEAEVSAQTASAHLAKLIEAGLVAVETVGRRRLHRLTGPDVVVALEALAVIAPPLPVRSLRESNRAGALQRARSCYDHLAGRLGVSLMMALIERGALVGHDGVHRSRDAVRDRPASYGRDVEYALSAEGWEQLSGLGVDPNQFARRRPIVRYCVDWSEKQHHLAGALGAALTARLLELGWIAYGPSPRVITVTVAGRAGLQRDFGLDLAD